MLRQRRNHLPYVLGGLLLALAGVLLHRGGSFYVLSIEERVVHADYRVLRPSGRLGHAYGFAALALVIANLAYLVRRHLASARLGPMRVWLDLHVFTGLSAALLVVFHSAFQLRSPIVKASAASVAMVVLTGLVGRFLHTLTRSDDEVRLRLALEAMHSVRPELHEPMATALRALPAPPIAANASLLKSVMAIPQWRRVARARRQALQMLAPPRRELDAPTRQALRLIVAASDAEARGPGMNALVRSWRGLHRFFALLMLATVGLHVGVAWHYGYRWWFG